MTDPTPSPTQGAEPRPGRRGGGRDARHTLRERGSTDAASFLTRTMRPFEIVSDEGLEIIEHNADTILEEVGIEFRELPASAGAHARRGRRRRRRAGPLPAGSVPQDRQRARAERLHPARPQPGAQRADRRRRDRLRPELRLAVRLRPRQRPALRDDRRLRRTSSSWPTCRRTSTTPAAPCASRSTSRSTSDTSTWCTPTCATATSRSWGRSPPASGRPTRSSWRGSGSVATSATAP